MYAGLVAFCAGVWLLQLQPELPPARWLWLLPLATCVGLLPRFAHPVAALLRRALIALVCAALGFAYAAWRADVRLDTRLPAHWQGVDIELVGVVTGLPQADARGERFRFDVERVLTPGAPTIERVQLGFYYPRDAVKPGLAAPGLITPGLTTPGSPTLGSTTPGRDTPHRRIPEQTQLDQTQPERLQPGQTQPTQTHSPQPESAHVKPASAVFAQSSRAATPPAAPRFKAGERWQLTARLKIPHGTHNPHGFDFEAWAMENAVAATGNVRTATGVRPPERLAARAATSMAWVSAARAAVRERIFTALADSPSAGVIAALTVGDQRAIPNAQWRAFTRTGTNHLLSISGLHVTMIASLAGWLFAQAWRRSPACVTRLPTRQAALIAAVCAGLAYAVLAGFEVPAQRTVFMLAALAIALWGRREVRPFGALLWALVAVLLLDPWAVTSAGFWLSFGAIAAIVWVSFGRVGRPQAWRGWLAIQWAVTLALAPALLLLFQQVSLISPFANLVAIPLVSLVVTPLALAGVLLDWITPAGIISAGSNTTPLWSLAAAIMDQLAAALIWAAGLPWAVASRPAPAPWMLVLALVGIVWTLMPRGFPLRALGLVLCLPMLFPPRAAIAPGDFVVDVIDVGQGTSVLVRTANRALLYDTGPSFGDSDAGERTVVPFLRAHGVGDLDGLVVSHDDNDHSGGMISVLRDLPTGWLLHALPAASTLLADAPHPRHCARGQRWQWDRVRFEVLNPQAKHIGEARRRDNDFSCVLKVSSPRGTLLLTGDAERRGELELLESGLPLKADVLLASHHGSRSSSLPEFVAATRPAHVVFTVGHRNRYGHPHPDVVARFAAVDAARWRSDRSGALTFRFGEAGVQASEYAPRHRRYWQAMRP